MADVLRVLRALVGLLLALALVSCSSSSDEPRADVVPPSEAVAAIEDGATVIDVRTPEEYEAGHLLGALNIDVSADDFDTRIEMLDPDGSFVVYGRTGTRAATAVRVMLDDGFDDVVNGGRYEDLEAAGGG
jgi:phage shock protein E